jgi:hypothetical protein
MLIIFIQYLLTVLTGRYDAEKNGGPLQSPAVFGHGGGNAGNQAVR